MRRTPLVSSFEVTVSEFRKVYVNHPRQHTLQKDHALLPLAYWQFTELECLPALSPKAAKDTRLEVSLFLTSPGFDRMLS